ncbi:hypothetical protein GIB67_010684 [Kingdonia uniflora]|uniref:Uncharacterized protein n=1 Tax=Kingdonia uniflora TaxID=39325 RepID=A0A7J7MNW7_9MAGN|nr:hypothetical protein GIB67_010684 [Kingdonia uniflora]
MKLANTSLSSFDLISSISFTGRRENASSQRRCSSKVMASKIGVSKLAKLVEVILGPKGRNVVELEDPVKNIGVKLVRQAAANINDLVGDGTTTSIVLAQGLIVEGVKVKDSELPNIVAVSMSNNFEMGQMIAKAMSKVGRRGVMTLEEGKSSKNNLYVIKGILFERGYISPYFVIDSEKMTVKFENYNIVAMKAPGFGERKTQYLDDIVILIEGGSLGHAAKVVLTKEVTTIVGNGSSQDAVAEQDYEKEKLNERIAKLSGSIVIIQVGAQTETELKEKKLRVEDVLNATKAAIEEGIVVGGGCTLLKLAAKVDAIKLTLDNDEKKIGDIVKRALSYPLKLIAKNVGDNGSVVMEKVLSSDNFKYGHNATTGKYED